MSARNKCRVMASLVLLVGVSLPAAQKKPAHAEPDKGRAETNAASNAATSEVKPKIDLKVYQLRPSDVVEVRVYQEDDLTTKARIAKDGTITMHLLGLVNIGGKTIEQANNDIKGLLA